MMLFNLVIWSNRRAGQQIIQISFRRLCMRQKQNTVEEFKNTVYPLAMQHSGRPHTNCVKTSIKTWNKRDKSWREHHDSDRCAVIFIISFVSTVLLSLRHVADIVSWLLHVLTHAGVRPTSGSQYATIPQVFSLNKRPFQTGVTQEFDEAYQNI
jgi:hypothetical protein